MCSCDYDNGPTSFWESWVIARKEHTCCECMSTISPGEKYRLNKGVWDGDFQTWKMCEICHRVFQAALSGTDNCICFGELWETVGVDYEEAGNV